MEQNRLCSPESRTPGFSFPASVREFVAMGLIPSSDFLGLLKRRTKYPSIKPGSRGFGRAETRRVGELSGVNSNALFIARAIVNRPGRPFPGRAHRSAWTRRPRRGFMTLLAELNRKEGLTIVLITHDFGIITKHANRVACLNQRLFFHGTHQDSQLAGGPRKLLHGEHHMICHRHEGDGKSSNICFMQRAIAGWFFDLAHLRRPGVFLVLSGMP